MDNFKLNGDKGSGVPKLIRDTKSDVEYKITRTLCKQMLVWKCKSQEAKIKLGFQGSVRTPTYSRRNHPHHPEAIDSQIHRCSHPSRVWCVLGTYARALQYKRLLQVKGD